MRYRYSIGASDVPDGNFPVLACGDEHLGIREDIERVHRPKGLVEGLQAFLPFDVPEEDALVFRTGEQVDVVVDELHLGDFARVFLEVRQQGLGRESPDPDSAV